ncbi:hypothetical protein Q1695_001313 [Nippostrongylus brasiliensis]|nr:hypothetical protein Q1695_001313 [Nippostrongylus brasiliensis]
MLYNIQYLLRTIVYLCSDSSPVDCQCAQIEQVLHKENGVNQPQIQLVFSIHWSTKDHQIEGGAYIWSGPNFCNTKSQ